MLPKAVALSVFWSDQGVDKVVLMGDVGQYP
jgi:hypothetical protein